MVVGARDASVIPVRVLRLRARQALLRSPDARTSHGRIPVSQSHNAGPAHPTGSFGRRLQRLIEIGDQVVRGLQSDRQADHIRTCARRHPLLVG